MHAYAVIGKEFYPGQAILDPHEIEKLTSLLGCFHKKSNWNGKMNPTSTNLIFKLIYKICFYSLFVLDLPIP